jgi:hypothetical protein
MGAVVQLKRNRGLYAAFLQPKNAKLCQLDAEIGSIDSQIALLTLQKRKLLSEYRKELKARSRLLTAAAATLAAILVGGQPASVCSRTMSSIMPSNNLRCVADNSTDLRPIRHGAISESPRGLT